MVSDIKLLDCTLRDGGYVNDWKWGYSCAKAIIRALVKAKVNMVEVGFLRNVEGYDRDITVCNYLEELNALLPHDKGDTLFSAMAMCSNYDISKLSDYSGSGIELIRITAHDYDLEEGLRFANQIKKKGYKVSINPINIMGYSDERILWILKRINEIQPYQFSIVDTFGSMKRRDLDRIVGIVDNNLSRNIRVALHLHENMSLSTCLAQRFIDMHLQRPIAVDGSLMGMGRIPGNLPIELISDYLNEYCDKSYDIDPMMDAIEDYIAPLKGETMWGYTPAYYLSAKYNLHRNYAEYFLSKGDLTNKDINHILARFDRSKTTAFDSSYADRLYDEYKNNEVDDTTARIELKQKIRGREILVIAPGASIKECSDKIGDYIIKKRPVVISVNCAPDFLPLDFVFFGNNTRFENIDNLTMPVIVTSNIPESGATYVIDYNSVCGAFEQGCNSLIMLLNLLQDLSVRKIVLAGADGYSNNNNDYYDKIIRSRGVHDTKFTNAVAEAIRNIKVPIMFLTPSAYA